MNTTNVGQIKGTNEISAKKTIAVIGRFMPPHMGHKKFLVDYAKNSNVKKLIIMIGSCYERGGVRFSITANEREKMIRAIMKRENIPEPKYKIIPVSDYGNFEEWILDVVGVCKENNVTHFCTGNQEDILDVLEEKQIKLGMELINPETNSDFPYHATDIRNMIIDGQYEQLNALIPNEVLPILFRFTFKEILAASQHKEIAFVAGRQTVDTIIIVKNSTDGKVYTLLGNRPQSKKDFPKFLAFPGGAIKKHETAINAAIRVLYEETGLKITMLDNSLEPAIIMFEDLPKPAIEQMHFSGLYGSDDISKNGTRGGTSQCFTILIEGNVEDYKELLSPHEGLTDVQFYEVSDAMKKKLAFEQNEMLKQAVYMLRAYPRLHI